MAVVLNPATVRVRIIRRPGDKEAAPVQDEMLVSEHMALMRGYLELNKLYYNALKLNVTCVTMLDNKVKDGDIVLAISEKFNVSAKYILRSRAITITPTSASENIVLERYSRP